jgi:hypothetical protein
MGTTASSLYEVGEESVDSCLWKGSDDCFLRFDGVTAEVWAGFVEKARGERWGIATENLEARKRVR